MWEPRRMHHPVARLPGPGMLLGEPGEHPPCEGCGRGMPKMGGMMGHQQEARWTSLEVREGPKGGDAGQQPCMPGTASQAWCTPPLVLRDNWCIQA